MEPLSQTEKDVILEVICRRVRKDRGCHPGNDNPLSQEQLKKISTKLKKRLEKTISGMYIMDVDK